MSLLDLLNCLEHRVSTHVFDQFSDDVLGRIDACITAAAVWSFRAGPVKQTQAVPRILGPPDKHAVAVKEPCKRSSLASAVPRAITTATATQL